MGKKIFITYKYADTAVQALPGIHNTKVRDYVDALQAALDQEDHINKGEQDGQSLKDFSDEHIASKLRDKIYDSSITIILISPNMKNDLVEEKDQWMPWEISYSLKEHTRDGRTSLTNAMLAVVLPDQFGSYGYYINYNQQCNSRLLNTNRIFSIMKRNMFNLKDAQTSECNGNKLYHGEHSYIPSVEWEDFIGSVETHIDNAIKINENIASYKIDKQIA